MDIGPTFCVQAYYTRGINSSVMLANMIFLGQICPNQGHPPIFFVCKHDLFIASMIYLTFLSQMYDTKSMRSTNNQKKKSYLLSIAACQSHPIGPFIKQETTPVNFATSSLKYHSLMETPNSILQGKAKVCVSNHICLKQDKTPQHSHSETHDTQGLAANQI